MDHSERVEQTNTLAGIGLFEAQRLLLQQGGTNFSHGIPKSEVIASLEKAWLTNADPEVAADYYRQLELYKWSMDTCTAAAHGLPLHQLAGSNTIAENNMKNENYSGLITTQSRHISDSFSSGDYTSAPNGASPLNSLYRPQSSAGAAQQLDNIACRIPNFHNIACENPNLPLAIQRWKNDHNKGDPNHVMNITGCSGNQEDAPSLPATRSTLLINNQTSHDLCTSSIDQREGLSLVNYLHDTYDAAGDDQMQPSSKFVNLDFSPSGFPSSVGVLRSSKYLRAAQQLLEEVCSVKLCYDTINGACTQSTTVVSTHSNPSSDDSLHGMKAAGPASTRRKQQPMPREQRRQLEERKAQLIGMVEELDRRYQQYRDHMQLIVTSFESATGMGSAAPYTALAKRSISRRFKALRDSIGENLHAACRMLGDDISSVAVLNKGETPRLRIIEQRVRHQQTLQQVCMFSQHHQGWRPQRGLPQQSVAVLRAWLFEHFLHPYPRDSEKLMLARLTGLTRNQVTNWFINARVRLWKPMVEQMYAEEREEAESQNPAKAEEIIEYGSSGGSKGNNVMVEMAMRENPPARHHYEHYVHDEECNSRTLQGSIMTKHGVSLTLALQRSSSVERAPNTSKPNHHYLLHPISEDADYNIAFR